MENKKMTVLEYIIAALFGGTIIIVATQVFCRYMLNNSLVWSEELSRYIYTWITLLGAMMAIEKGTHVRIDFLIEKMSSKSARYIMVLNSVIIAAFLIFISITGFKLVAFTKNALSPALSLPINYVFYTSLPITALLGIYYCIKNIVKIIKVKPVIERNSDKG